MRYSTGQERMVSFWRNLPPTKIKSASGSMYKVSIMSLFPFQKGLVEYRILTYFCIQYMGHFELVTVILINFHVSKRLLSFQQQQLPSFLYNFPVCQAGGKLSWTGSLPVLILSTNTYIKQKWAPKRQIFFSVFWNFWATSERLCLWW